MKYMGSKRAMLMNGLGELLRIEAKTCHRVVDLFCGSASVSWFSAQELGKPVLATDLQEYAVVLAESVIGRESPICAKQIKGIWLRRASDVRKSYSVWTKAQKLDSRGLNTAAWSKQARTLCDEKASCGGLIWRSYGGHYFSPTQALAFDAMLESLPEGYNERKVCLAAAIIAASKCVAAPGHTAQPFRASRTAAKFLREAWLRDPFHYAMEALNMLCHKHALRRGEAKVGDANIIATELNENDLVFVDPPYSGVHYSRFYHVLETIARGRCGNVEGVGRYPPSSERPMSRYSRKRESTQAMKELLSKLSSRGCKVIVTFPAGECSNGLTGSNVERMAKALFHVERKVIISCFSTLGGNNHYRKARSVGKEMILMLSPD